MKTWRGKLRVYKPVIFCKITPECIAETLQDALTSWKLGENGLVTITTDNGSNVIKAVEVKKWLRMVTDLGLHLAIGECDV